MNEPATPPRLPSRPLLIGAGVLAGLLLAAWAALALGAAPVLRWALEAKLHRRVAFSRLDVRGGPGLLHLVFRDLRVGQPAEFGPGDLLQAPRAELTLRPLPLLVGRVEAPEAVVERPLLALRRHGPGHDNWTLGRRGGGGGGASGVLGATRRLEIRDGRVTMDDPQRRLTLRATFSNDPADAALPLHLDGAGGLKGAPYRVAARGGPLNGRKHGAPHRIDVFLVDGDARTRLQGTTQAPFDFRGLDVDARSQGPNLADLAYLFGLLAPNSPPYALRAHLHRAGRLFEATDIDARLGDSDVQGSVRSDHRKRRTLSAVLRSHRLAAGDLAVLLASPPPHAEAREEPGRSGKGRTPSDKVFSRTPVSLRRLGDNDVALDYRAESVTGYGRPLADARLGLRLADGRLRLQPLAFTADGGRVTASYALDLTRPVPLMSVDVRLDGLRLGGGAGGVAGRLDGEVHAHGAGASTAAAAADASGSARFRLRGGSAPGKEAAVLGGDLFGLVGAVLAPSRVPLRCALAEFRLQDGVARATRLVIGTAQGEAVGGGTIDLREEALHLQLTAGARSGGGAGPVSFKTPITVTGPLKHPHVSARLTAASFGLGGLSGLAHKLGELVGGAKPQPAAPGC